MKQKSPKKITENIKRNHYIRSTYPLNITYRHIRTTRSKQKAKESTSRGSMDVDLGTTDAELNNAKSTNKIILQCTPIKCKESSDKYQLECTKCKRLVH